MLLFRGLTSRRAFLRHGPCPRLPPTEASEPFRATDALEASGRHVKKPMLFHNATRLRFHHCSPTSGLPVHVPGSRLRRLRSFRRHRERPHLGRRPLYRAQQGRAAGRGPRLGLALTRRQQGPARAARRPGRRRRSSRPGRRPTRAPWRAPAARGHVRPRSGTPRSSSPCSSRSAPSSRAQCRSRGKEWPVEEARLGERGEKRAGEARSGEGMDEGKALKEGVGVWKGDRRNDGINGTWRRRSR